MCWLSTQFVAFFVAQFSFVGSSRDMVTADACFCFSLFSSPFPFSPIRFRCKSTVGYSGVFPIVVERHLCAMRFIDISSVPSMGLQYEGPRARNAATT